MADTTGTDTLGSASLSADASTQPKTTGWQNVERAYVFNRETGEVSREAYELILMFFAGTFAGGLYGGWPASRHARNRYIQTSAAALYPSKLEAVGTSYNAGTRGFIRYGFRWGWRSGFLAVSFHGISSFLAVYRDKTDILNYTVASGPQLIGGIGIVLGCMLLDMCIPYVHVCTGALYRFNMGFRGAIGGSAVGALLGVPAGCLLLGVQKLYGETFLEMKKKERSEQIQEKQQELMEKEKMFGTLIGGIHTSMNLETKDEDPHR